MSVALLVKYNEDQRRIGAEHKCLELGMGQYEVDVKTKEIKFRYFVNPVELRVIGITPESTTNENQSK